MNYENLVAKYMKQEYGTSTTPELIGEGSYAEVYIVDDYAVKVTNDIHDIILSNRMIGVDAEHVVKTFSTAVVEGEDDLYIIVNELQDTEELSQEERFSGTEISSVYKAYIDESTINMDGLIWGLKSRVTLLSNGEEEAQEFLDKYVPQIEAMALECRSLGFQGLDFHKDNLGINSKGKLCLIDLGHRSSDGNLQENIKRFVI